MYTTVLGSHTLGSAYGLVELSSKVNYLAQSTDIYHSSSSNSHFVARGSPFHIGHDVTVMAPNNNLHDARREEDNSITTSTDKAKRNIAHYSSSGYVEVVLFCTAVEFVSSPTALSSRASPLIRLNVEV